MQLQIPIRKGKHPWEEAAQETQGKIYVVNSRPIQANDVMTGTFLINSITGLVLFGTRITSLFISSMLRID
ncbi:hypothetical protein [Citrobacter youngae]|uniref:hypothetical protein n=1 Tax=Citrobacter youngae TaxID=133448 RepID=UPI003D7D3672